MGRYSMIFTFITFFIWRRCWKWPRESQSSSKHWTRTTYHQGLNCNSYARSEPNSIAVRHQDTFSPHFCRLAITVTMSFECLATLLLWNNLAQYDIYDLYLYSCERKTALLVLSNYYWQSCLIYKTSWQIMGYYHI